MQDGHLLFAFPEADLRKLDAPTLLLVGQHEIFYKPEVVLAKANKVLPNLRAAEIVPGAGHAMHADHPDVVNARILKFLKGTE